MDPKHLALLRLHDACRGLSADEIEAIAAEVDIVRADAGQLIHAAGDQLDAVFIVVEGRLKMSLKTPDGQRRVIRYISGGDQFGALMLASDEEIPVDVDVDETAVLFRLAGNVCEQLADKYPVFRRNLLRKIGVAVRDSMHWRRKRKTSKAISFTGANERSAQLVNQVVSRLEQAGERIGMLGDNSCPRPNPGIPFKSLRNAEGDYIDASEVHAAIQQWPDVQRIIQVVDRGYPADRLAQLFETSDGVFCLSDTGNYQSVVGEIGRLISGSPSWKNKTHIVWVLDEDEQVAPLVPELSTLMVRDFKVQLTEPHTVSRLFTQGIDRLVHYLRGVSIGIALSGSAAHGMTHLGVLKALEEAGITIDRMAGTSAGVLTGVLYCAGFSPDWGIRQFTHDLEPGALFKWIPKGDGFYMLEKYRSGSWDPMLRKYLQDWRLEQFPIPINTVTTDLISAQSVARSTGDGVDSILESINLPVLSPPICRDGMLLVDGGILNNLPADVLVNQGCNFVIGVDVAANIEHRVGKNFPDTPTDKMKSPGVVTTLLRSLSVQAHNMSCVGAQPADVIIAPDVSMFDSTAFTQTSEMAEIGYQATLESLPRIREVLHNLDGQLFQLTGEPVPSDS